MITRRRRNIKARGETMRRGGEKNGKQFIAASDFIVCGQYLACRCLRPASLRAPRSRGHDRKCLGGRPENLPRALPQARDERSLRAGFGHHDRHLPHPPRVRRLGASGPRRGPRQRAVARGVLLQRHFCRCGVLGCRRDRPVLRGLAHRALSDHGAPPVSSAGGGGSRVVMS